MCTCVHQQPASEQDDEIEINLEIVHNGGDTEKKFVTMKVLSVYIITVIKHDTQSVLTQRRNCSHHEHRDP
jgi:hypothetical protein